MIIVLYTTVTLLSEQQKYVQAKNGYDFSEINFPSHCEDLEYEIDRSFSLDMCAFSLIKSTQFSYVILRRVSAEHDVRAYRVSDEKSNKHEAVRVRHVPKMR